MKRDSESIEGVALMLVWVPGEARAKPFGYTCSEEADNHRDKPGEVLKDFDSRGLLGSVDQAAPNLEQDEPTDDELLAALGVEATMEQDVKQLVHVRSREEIKAAEEVAQWTPCRDP